MCYLSAIREQCHAVGSRGGAVVLKESGAEIHPKLPSDWRLQPEETEYRKKVMTLDFDGETAKARVGWEACRPAPETDGWFESVWKDFREGKIYE